MRHLKINKHMIVTTIVSSITLIGITLFEVVNLNSATAYERTAVVENFKYNTNNLVTIEEELFTEEVDLNSAGEYSEKILELKNKYQSKFSKILGDKLAKVSDKKIEKIMLKIDKILENTKNNSKITENKKEKILAQLLALQELFGKELESREELSIDIDLDSIFEV